MLCVPLLYCLKLVALTKYVDKYSEELYNSMLYGNATAKLIKKQLREIDKQLKGLGYVETEIEEKVALNIDFARKYLVDTIYKQAVLEGIATTYADTETIIEGGKVNNMTADDVLKVINLKHAWEFILNKDVTKVSKCFQNSVLSFGDMTQY